MRTDRPYGTITTKFIGPTDTKGARIRAVAGAGKRVCVGFSYEARDGFENQRPAAEVLLGQINLERVKMDLPELKLGPCGSLPDANAESYVWLLV